MKISVCGVKRRKLPLIPSHQIWLTMKLTAFLLTMAMMQVSANGIAQNVTYSGRNVSLEKAFTFIREQTGYVFFYRNDDLARAKPVTVQIKNEPIKSALELLLQNQPLTFTIIGNTIVIKQKDVVNEKASGIIPIEKIARNQVEVKGKVIDERGYPLPSVSVVIGGTPIGAMTDQNGVYSIPNAPDNASLVFSYVGYVTQIVPIKGRSVINVTLQLEVKKMDETVIIGYGRTTKLKNTGAISSITEKDISIQPIDNPLTALQGRIPGVLITQDNGLPGGGVRVQIRGINSADAGTIPLYIVDGVPFTLFSGGQPISDALNAYGTSGANGNISPFSMIAPEDILRIDILKDADATAIYGSRGANGVILITTKKGSQGKTMFNLNVNTGIGQVNHFIPMLNTSEYLAMRREAFKNSNVTPTTSNAKDLLVWDTTAYTDWQKWAIGGTAHYTNATASLSGGNAQNNFLFSSTFRKQGTVFPGDFENYTTSNRINAGHKSADNKFSIDAAVNYTYMNNDLPSTDLSTFYNLAPNFPMYNPDGSLNFSLTNPESYLRKKYTSQTMNLISSLNIDYKILPSLTMKVNLGYTLTSLKQIKTNPASSQNISPSAPASVKAMANKLTYADNDNSNYIIEPQLLYERKIGQGNLQLLVGSTFQQNKASGVYLNGSGYSSEELLTSISSASTVSATYSNFSIYKYSALFSRVNYNWENKYIINGTFRRDGSSRFGPDHRFGNFGSVGAAWIFSKEKFLDNNEILSFGKLRASYGITGNDQISNYLYNALYNAGWSGYSYMGSGILLQYSPANPNLHWESTKKLDIALELGFLKDRISLTADFYQNRSSNQLLYVAMPSQSGFTSYTGNLPATIQNTGWEFNLNTTNISGKNFSWTSWLNLTFNRNRLVAFPDLANSSYASTYIIGQPVNVTLGYHYTGLDVNTGKPTFTDQNMDGSIDYDNDRIPMKIGTPYYGGLTNKLSYKGISLEFTFQFNHRYGYIDNTLNDYHISYYPPGYNYYNQSIELLDRWTSEKQSGHFPAPGVKYDFANSNLASSDFNWGNTSFVKFKTLSIAYELPKEWIQHLKLSNCTVYAQGQNLYTWAKQKYTYDPETTQPGTGSGLGTGTYIAFPQLRTMVLGIKLSL